MGGMNDNDIFSPNQYEGVYYEAAVVANRAPDSRDRNYEISKVWIDKTLDDVYVLTSVKLGVPSWINCGGGAGVYASVTATTGDITATLGDLVATAGDLIATAGSATLGGLGEGILITSAAGVVTALADGNDGEILIGTTGGRPAWSTITAGAGITIVEAAGTITISNPGATGTTFGTDAGGPVSPTGGGLTTFEGYDANITTDGATANTVRIRLSDAVTTVGALTAGVDLSMASGTCTITSDDNSTDAIYLHANAGTSEQIHIRANQGTAANSVILASDDGGVLISGGLNSADAINIQTTDAAGGIDVDFGTGGLSVVGANGAINLESGTAAINVGVDAVAHTVTVGTTTGAGSTVLQSGTGDLIMTSTDDITIDAVGVLELNSSTGIIGIGNDAVAQNINIGIGAAARTITVGNNTGATGLVFNSGTGGIDIDSTGAGDITLNSDDTLLLDADGVLELNSSAGVIGIGNDADAQAINIGTGAAARTITIGNVTGASQTVVDCGTLGVTVGSSATAHPSTFGSITGNSATTLNTGTGALTVTAGGIIDVNGTGDLTVDLSAGIVDVSVTGNITLDSSAGTIGIGVDADAQNINVGTGAAARTITVGNATGATSVVVNSGTGAANFASNATDHTTTLGSATGVSATTVSSGTGGLTFAAAGIVDMVPAVDSQAAAATTINANAGVSTHTGLTTAAAASQVFTITNSVCTVGSAILCSMSNLGANDAQMTITRITPGAGSFTVTGTNNGAAALNGDVIITFWIIAA